MNIRMTDYKFHEICSLNASYLCPVLYELFMVAAKTSLATIGDVLLNMPNTTKSSPQENDTAMPRSGQILDQLQRF